jgi:uncharacterized protein YrrD
MFRVSDLLDIPIIPLIEATSSKYTVKSILIDGFGSKISAIICKEGTIKKNLRVIGYNKIISIDTNGIIISDTSNIEKKTLKDVSNFIQLDAIINSTVKGIDGELYGMITDIYINLLNGRIIGYELSEGYLDDIVNGRRIITIPEVLNNIMVKKEIILHERLN